MNIIIMGPQGSGKTTQGKLLADRMGIPHISTGDMYRAIAKEDTDLGRRVKAFLDAGELVDDPTTFEAVDKHLGEIKSGFVIDGFPRTLVQAEREVFPVTTVIYLDVDSNDLSARLKERKREDDTPELIAKRLELFHEKTEPIIGYYRSQGKLIDIDGRGTVEQVHALILAALGLRND